MKQISPSNNQEAKPNPRALAHLDGYKRPLVGSVSANLQRFGLNNVANLESLQEIIAEMSDDDGTGDNPSSDCPLSAAKKQGRTQHTSGSVEFIRYWRTYRQPVHSVSCPGCPSGGGDKF